MKIIVIPCEESDPNYDKFNNNFLSLLFQIDYDFYIIYYAEYLHGYSHLDLKESFLSRVLQLKKNDSSKLINRGYRFSDIKQDIETGIIFKNKIKEVCYKYQDNSGKFYCFTNSNNYLNFIELQNNYCANYTLAKNKINEQSILHQEHKYRLLKQLDDLYYSNSSVVITEREQIKLTDLLSKRIIKRLK